jgi:putative transposase
MARTKPWELSDAVWERAEPLLPPPTPHPKGGRPPRDDRQMLGAMLDVLRTGLQWNALPRAIGASTTVYDRFRAWERDGFFERLWAAGLGEFDESVGIDWEWRSLDGAMTKAPFGRAATAAAEAIGHTPTDRGKHGTKRSTLSEGHGLPLAVVVAGANVHDMKSAAPTLDALVVERPAPSAARPQHLCLDAGYDDDLPRFAAEQRGSTPPMSARAARTAPTPARPIQTSDRAAGWSSGCIAGSTARAASWSVGRSWSARTRPSCIWRVPSSASSGAIATERHYLFPNKD